MLELSRWCARAALLVGALSVVEGLLIMSDPEYYGFDSPLELLVLVVEGAVLLAALGGLVGLHVLQSASYGRWGVAGFLAASGGPALAGAGHIGAVPFFDFVNVGGLVYALFGPQGGGLPRGRDDLRAGRRRHERRLRAVRRCHGEGRDAAGLERPGADLRPGGVVGRERGGMDPLRSRVGSRRDRAPAGQRARGPARPETPGELCGVRRRSPSTHPT
jgi:hypothetical protein